MSLRTFALGAIACTLPLCASADALVELDRAFAGTGVVVLPATAPASSYTLAHLPRKDKGSVAVVVASGGNCPANRRCVVILGFNDRGALVTFGGPDASVISFASVGGAALDSQGRVVIAGSTETTPGNYDFQVLRLLPSGLPDAGFGSGGIARVAFDFGGDLGDIANAVAVDATDRIVVAGSVQRSATLDTDFAVARLRTNGTLDPTFDGDGRRAIPFDLAASNPADIANAVAVHGNGKIVVAGRVFDFAVGVNRLGIARLTADGALDTTWCEVDCIYTYGNARDGKRVIFYGDASEIRDHTLAHLAVGDGGEVIIAGRMRFAGVFNGYLHRFSEDGEWQFERTIDAGDSSPGSITTLGSVSLVDPTWPGSDMIVTGTTGPSGDNRFFAQRLTFDLQNRLGWANGAPDTSILQYIGSDSLFDPGTDLPGMGSIDARERVLTAGTLETPTASSPYGAMIGRLSSPTSIFFDGLENDIPQN